MSNKDMHTHHPLREAGFSLIELMIAMTVTLVVMGLASTLLASSFNMRAREDRRSDAIADVQRALNIMTREISNAGFSVPTGLAGVARNGIVAGDSNNQSLRIVSNFNSLSEAMPDVTDPDEDVKYLMYADDALGQRYIVRHDSNGIFGGVENKTTVLANRIDSLVLRYYDEKVTYDTTVNAVTGNCDITNVMNAAGSAEAEVAPGNARYIVIAVGTTLRPVGAPGSPGYQPESRAQLTSDVVLRNAITY